MKMRAPKGEGAATLDDLAEHAGGLVCLTGGARRPGGAPRSRAGGARGRRERLERLVGIFGRFDVFAELQRHLEPRGGGAQRVAARARPRGCACRSLATNEPRLIAARGPAAARRAHVHPRAHHARRRGPAARAQQRALHEERRAMMERLFADCPEAVANTGELALRLGFTLEGPGLPLPRLPAAAGARRRIGFLRAARRRGARAAATARDRSPRRRGARSSTSST